MDLQSQDHTYSSHERTNMLKTVNISENAIPDQLVATNSFFASSQSRKLPYLTGWRKGVTTGTCLVALSLVINLVVIIGFIVHFGIEDGLIVLYAGECSRVSNINLAIHLIINGLGTLLLSASNYCMQVLSAPTRREVDRAHARRKWLDIGMSSFRNLFRIQSWRVCIWALLVISSLPLHLVYNSVIFSSIGAYQYTGMVVSPAFISASPYNESLNIWITNEVIPNPPTLAEVQQVQADASSFQRLDNSDCINMYHKALVTDRSDLILVSSFQNASDDDSKVYLTFRDGDFYVDFDGFASWICETYNVTEWEKCLSGSETPDPRTWSIHDHPIDYCLSRQTPEVCKVKSSLYLMIIVIICNLAKLVAMCITLFKFKDDPLVTIGDAVSSFMSRPDDTTTNACLLSKKEFASGEFWKEANHIKTFKRQRVFRFQAVSVRRWWLSVIACLIAIIVIVLFLDRAIIGIEQGGVISNNSTPTLKQIWSFGFGLGNGASFWNNAPQSLYGNIILANLPQLIFSILYFVYNGLYTVMSLSSEWSSYSRTRKGLRVSRPTGVHQRSTYYLQLPFTYAIPLIIASTLMHWFISQSFYLLSVDFTGTSKSEILSFTTCGYSGIAIIFGLGLAGLMLIIIFINGFRRLTFDIPPVGSCSVAISAACHPPPTSSLDGQEDDMSILPLQWGVVPQTSHDYNQEKMESEAEAEAESDIAHCSFSSGEVLPPVEGERYA